MEYIAVFAESDQDFNNFLKDNIPKENWGNYICTNSTGKVVGCNFSNFIFTEKMKNYSAFVELYHNVIYRVNREKKPKIPGDRFSGDGKPTYTKYNNDPKKHYD